MSRGDVRRPARGGGAAHLRAILRDPEGPGLPIRQCRPPEPGEDPHTEVAHTQDSTEEGTEPEDDPRLTPNFGVTPELLESIGIEVDRMPEMTDHERGWRAGRGAAGEGGLGTLRSTKNRRGRRRRAAVTDALFYVANLQSEGGAVEA